MSIRKNVGGRAATFSISRTGECKSIVSYISSKIQDKAFFNEGTPKEDLFSNIGERGAANLGWRHMTFLLSTGATETGLKGFQIYDTSNLCFMGNVKFYDKPTAVTRP